MDCRQSFVNNHNNPTPDAETNVGFWWYKKEHMKRAIKNWILKNYPPIVMTILISVELLALGIRFSVIENAFAGDIPVHLR